MYCSPKGKANWNKSGTCMSRAALVRIARAYNVRNPDNKVKLSGSIQSLWEAINKRMEPSCGDGIEHCWLKRLPEAKAAAIDDFVPEMPKEWLTNEYSWLTNIDIENVMGQYEADKSYSYKFMGAVPVDFDKVPGMIPPITFAPNKKHKYLGFVINTDPHYKDGEHWISLFVIVDPNQAWGAYFYDSVGDRPPKEVEEFMYKLQKMAATVNPTKPFKLFFSKKRIQRGNSECGVFSIAYQIRWLNLLRDKKNIDFHTVIDQPISDNVIHELRKILFRP